MKNRIIGICLVVIMAMALVMPANARSGRETMEVIFNNIRVVVDGREVDLRDANGVRSIRLFTMGLSICR